KLTRPLEEIRIPGTVQEVIAARLDRLSPPAKRVVQVAAVLGRQFRRDQLAALLAGEDIDVDHELGELEQRGVFHRKHLLAADEHFRRATLSATFGLARLGVLFGWPTAAEAERAAHRARELAEALGDTETLAGVLYFLGVISTFEGDFERGIELAEKAVGVA